MEKCEIIVNSCDNYSDLWQPFFQLFTKYWKDCPYKIILNTETKSFSYPGLSINTYSMNAGEKRWGKRFLDHLDKVDTEYVLLLLDDFFLRDYVDQTVIDKCLSLMDEDKSISCFQFIPVKDPNNVTYEPYPIFEVRPKEARYKLTLQAGVWRVEDLKTYIFPEESPWDFELLANIRTFVLDKKFITLKMDEKRIFNYGHNFGAWGVFRGKWVIEDVKPLFDENNIHIDYSIRGVYEKPVEHNDFFHYLLRLGEALIYNIDKYQKEKVQHNYNKHYLKYGTWR